MAYQNVGTPRFYINVIEWLTSNDVNVLNPVGGTVWNSSVWNTLPVTPTVYYPNWYLNNSAQAYDLINIPGGVFGAKSFWAILGHNWSPSAYSQFLREGAVDYSSVDLINFGQPPLYSGFSIATYNLTDVNNINVMASHNVGSMVLGTYYDMNAPNLSLTMSREYGGTKEFTNHNGGSMSNTMWSKPSKWGGLGAWELSASPTGYPPSLSKSGRRSWDLNFSYMADDDLWGSNQSLSTILETDINGLDMAPQAIFFPEGVSIECYASNVIDGLIPQEVRDQYLPDLYQIIAPDRSCFWSGSEFTGSFKNETFEGGVQYEIKMSADTTTDIFYTSLGFQYNLLTDDSFFSQVWHKTLGGTLPFIFQPDSSNNNPDQFCIAKFKENSLKATQSAFNVYDISLSIEEVW